MSSAKAIALCWCVICAPVLLFVPGVTSSQNTSRTFPETGKSVGGTFLEYWEAHGGLPQQGFPISGEMQERSDTDGKTYTVQYFERAVFELHPENSPPNDVLLSLLGVLRYGEKYPDGAPNQRPDSTRDSVLFLETGKRLGGAFLSYWLTHGGLRQQGFPISEEFEEVSDLDGKVYKVQYFERAVFERHPENAGTPYEVLLSQLGTFRYRLKYASAGPTPASTTISPAALAYLREALDYIQQNSIMRDRVDWVRWRSEALAMASSAQTGADTYNAIRHALRSLGDNHSGFLTPAEYQSSTAGTMDIGLLVSYAERKVLGVTEGSEAEAAGLRPGDTIEQVNGKQVDSMTANEFFTELYQGNSTRLALIRGGMPLAVVFAHSWQDPSLVPKGRRLEIDIGYIQLPTHVGSRIIEQYASIVQQLIRDQDQTPVCGWVVDLQADWGGALSPMVLGAGPILGEGDAGAFINADGKRDVWSYRNGAYLYGGEVLRKLDAPYHLKQPMPPVAVLTGPSTASAGEATLISFRGRPRTRTFGEPTAGVPTGNSGTRLSDGAFIRLTTALEADRTGRVYGYNERIQADEYVSATPWLMGTDDDPVMRAGVAWLRKQSPCAP